MDHGRQAHEHYESVKIKAIVTTYVYLVVGTRWKMESLWWGIFGCQGARQGIKRRQAVENTKSFRSHVMFKPQPSSSVNHEQQRLSKGVENIDHSSPRW